MAYSNNSVDLATYFLAYQTGTKVITGYSYNGSDLGNIYQPYSYGAKAPATNYYKLVSSTQTDLNQLFQNITVPLSIIDTSTSNSTTASYVETRHNNYKIITITGSGRMTFNQTKELSTILVGGGGGGGGYHGEPTYINEQFHSVVGGGGGGGGGMCSYTMFVNSSTSIDVTIGNGGTAGTQIHDYYNNKYIQSTNGGNGGSTSITINSNTSRANGGSGGSRVINGVRGDGGLGGTAEGIGQLYNSITGASGNSYPRNTTSILNSKSNTDMSIINNSFINKKYGGGGANDGSSYSNEGSGGSGGGANNYSVVNSLYNEGDSYRLVDAHNATSGKNGVIYLYYT